MEAGLASLAEPGETVIVAACGFFGNRMIDIARRHRPNVIELRAPFGQAVPTSGSGGAGQHPETRLVAVVHAETSTGVAHPLEQLGEACATATRC